jgi:hypothetical protein
MTKVILIEYYTENIAPTVELNSLIAKNSDIDNIVWE